MSTNCPTCGASVDVTPLRGRFAKSEAPLRVYYDGKLVELSAKPTAILARLAGAEFVSLADLIALGVKSRNSLAAHLSGIRQVLPESVTIDSDFGSGYRLILPT
jgi:hypothetical protein